MKGVDSMAAVSTRLQSSLVLKYVDGVDEKGKEIIKSQRFSKVKTNAADQDLYDVALKVEDLLGKTLNELIREDENSITNA
jgi:23S rRNA maturation mini-RNase III